MANLLRLILICILLLIVTISCSNAASCNGETASRCDKYCGQIYWKPYNDTAVTTHGVTRRSKRAEEDLSADLEAEADKNPPLRKALDEARIDENKINSLVENYKDIPLTPDEVALIVAYTVDIEDISEDEPQFYSDLNADYRATGNDNGKWKMENVSKNMFRDALIKIAEARPLKGLRLYRKEPQFLIGNYQNYSANKYKFTLNMFTSTSRSDTAFECKPTDMVTHFINADTGVDIDDFSDYDEEEVLLPPEYGFVTVTSTNDEANPKEAYLKGPGLGIDSTMTNQATIVRAELAFVILLLWCCVIG